VEEPRSDRNSLINKTVEIPQGKGSKSDAGKSNAGGHKFTFDRVFPMNTTQVDIYDSAALPIVESVFEGFNGTIFAYGQTSSGKTHTMQGVDIHDEQSKGIIPRIVCHIFNQIDEASEDIEFTVKVSMIEIYMERIRDLLDPKKINLQVHEDKEKGVFIGDVTETYVTEAYEVYQIMQLGNENRAIGVTDMNKQSSRSHSCFILTITQNNAANFQCKTGKLYLVDLAGSEKISKTHATGQTLDEAKKINKSLSALGMVINSLTDGKSKHIPYRDSKLTRILQESLGGNSKTCLIITCSPSSYNEAETISTLRFGQRAKKIQNKPKINKEMSVAELKMLLEEAEKEIERKDRRIKNLEKIIAGLGGTVPEDKDVYVPRKKEESPSRTRDKLKDFDDLEEANAKIDALEVLSNESSDAEYSDNEDERDTDLIEDDDAEELDEVPSDLGTDISDKGKKKTHKPKQKSEIDTINETFAMLEDAAKVDSKDAETMTEFITTVSVKTNTTPPKTITVGTSLSVELNTVDTMTIVESNEFGCMTEEVKDIKESGIQTFPIDSNDKNTLTDPIEFYESKKIEEEKEEIVSPLKAEEAITRKDEMTSRIDSIEKEYSESGIQAHIELKSFEAQTSTLVIEQSIHDKLAEEYNSLLKTFDEEMANSKAKLNEAIATIEDQKKSLSLKEKTLHEQIDEIEQLTDKVRDLQSSLSEDKDLCESQKEIIDKYELKIQEQHTQLEEQENLVNVHAEKIMTIEKDLKNKEEQFKEKNEELMKAKEQAEEVSKKYGILIHQFDLIR
jgi:kinesin family member 5